MGMLLLNFFKVFYEVTEHSCKMKLTKDRQKIISILTSYMRTTIRYRHTFVKKIWHPTSNFVNMIKSWCFTRNGTMVKTKAFLLCYSIINFQLSLSNIAKRVSSWWMHDSQKCTWIVTLHKYELQISQVMWKRKTMFWKQIMANRGNSYTVILFESCHKD